MKTEKESLVGKIYEDNDVPLVFEEGETTTTVYSGLVGNETDGYFIISSASCYLEDDENYLVAKAPYTGSIYDEEELNEALYRLVDDWNWRVLYQNYNDMVELLDYQSGCLFGYEDEDRAYEEWKYREVDEDASFESLFGELR